MISFRVAPPAAGLSALMRNVSSGESGSLPGTDEPANSPAAGTTLAGPCLMLVSGGKRDIDRPRGQSIVSFGNLACENGNTERHCGTMIVLYVHSTIGG